MSGYVLSPRAVRTLRQLVRGSATTTGSTYAPASISADEFAAPFTVRWSAAEDDGAGAWCIWLPALSGLVYYADTAISSISGVTACQELTTGWYTISDASASDTTVYLVVTVVESTGVATAEISTSAGSATTGERVYNITVATMATDSATGAVSVKQYTDSVVTLGGEGGGSTVVPDDKSTEYIHTPSGQTPGADEGKLQIKGWKTGTPASSTSLASDIFWEYTNEALVARDLTDGTLRYKPIGDLATLLGSQVSKANQKILTGLRWDTPTHTLVISSATVTIDHGVITAWTDNNNETISTTSINSIIN